MEVSSIPVGTLGVTPISLPLVELGSGSPRIMVVAAQHGNEQSGPVILKDLIEAGQPARGTFVLIPVANPLGLVLGSRNEPASGRDLNRSAPGNIDGDFAKRLAARILKVAQTCNGFVDLHTFSRQTKVVGILPDNGSVSVRKRQLALLAALAPDLIWRISPDRSADRRFQGGLDLVLAAEGIPAIALELPRIEWLTRADRNRVVAGLRRLTEQPVRRGTLPAIYDGHYGFSPTAGVFEPTVSLLETVALGQRLGTITSLIDFTTTDVTAPIASTVLTIAATSIVSTGSKLYSLGTPRV